MLSDKQLLEKYRKENDNQCLGELFGRYIRFVFLVSMKYLRNEEMAKDLSMQVFEKLTDDLKRFDIENFKSWLHVVTRNACLMHLRVKPMEKTFSIHDENGTPAFMENGPEMHPMEANLHEVKLEQLERAMETLEEEQKKCIRLFYLQEKSYKEVADITGFSMNQVKSHIQNGKRNLKNYLISRGEVLVWILVCIYIK